MENAITYIVIFITSITGISLLINIKPLENFLHLSLVTISFLHFISMGYKDIAFYLLFIFVIVELQLMSNKKQRKRINKKSVSVLTLISISMVFTTFILYNSIRGNISNKVEIVTNYSNINFGAFGGLILLLMIGFVSYFRRNFWKK